MKLRKDKAWPIELNSKKWSFLTEKYPNLRWKIFGNFLKMTGHY